MLTPQEISGKEFVKAVFGGYDMSAVDDFLEILTADYSALYKENAILKSKIKVLVEKVEEYRSTDDAMRMALLTAQRLGEEITSEAKKKSEEMLSQTEIEVKDRIADMRSKFVHEEARLQAVREETQKFILASQEIVRQHAGFLSKLEELNRVQETSPIIEDDEELAEAATLEQAQEAEDDVAETADQIDSALERLSEADEDPFTQLFSDEDTKKIFIPSREKDKPNNDNPTSPRPKFDFKDLKFGSNYSGD